MSNQIVSKTKLSLYKIREWWEDMGFDPNKQFMLEFFIDHYISRTWTKRLLSWDLYSVFLMYAERLLSETQHSSSAETCEPLKDGDLEFLQLTIGEGRAYKLIAQGRYDESLSKLILGENETFGLYSPSRIITLLALHVYSTMMQDPEKFRYAMVPT